MLNKNIILKYINILRDKPYMIINKIDGYHSYESYINGLFFEIDISLNLSITNNFSSWVGNYYGIENTNVHWTSLLRIQLKDKTEEEMIKSLFNLLNEFLEKLDIHTIKSLN